MQGRNIAIIAITYNRIDSLRRLLCSLENAFYSNYNPPLIISIDKSDTDDVFNFANSYHWPHGNKIIDYHTSNLGLKQHMLSLGKWFEEYDAIVVLEDDIVVSPNFFHYTRQCVNKYFTNSLIAGISLYSFEVNYQTGTPFQPVKNQYDIYLMSCAMSWGEVWMKNQWLKFYEWYQHNTNFPYSDNLPLSIQRWGSKSWLKYHTRYCIEQKLYFVFPYFSLSTNYSDFGEHNQGGQLTSFQTNLQRGEKKDYYLPDDLAKCICYDGFFENEGLYQILSLTKENCCIDLCGSRAVLPKRQFYLTTSKYDLPILKTYGISYRPIEMNVFQNVPGNGIFLYDARKARSIKRIESPKYAMLFNFHINNIISFINQFGFKNLIRDYLYAFRRKYFKK